MDEKKSMWEKMGPIMMIVMVVMAFALGSMWSKLQYSNTKPSANKNPTADANQAQPAPVQADLATIKKLWDDKNLIRFGDNKRKVLFVDVSDPSCPYCHVAAGKDSELNKQVGQQFILKADGGTYVAPVPEMRKLVESGKAAYVFIYMPGHGNGEMATKALYCANEKGKYWAVHDLLMSNAGYNLLNNTVKNDKAQAGTLADFLKSAMNSSDMKRCLESGKYDAQLTSDTNLARGMGVEGTPGFFVNDKKFGGAYSWNDMQSSVDASL